jgi:hypothetical protein
MKANKLLLSLLCLVQTATAQSVKDSADIFYHHLNLNEVTVTGLTGQSRMREMVEKASTVICLATMLHTIATGNMTPSFRVRPDGSVRPVYFYCVDADEFVTGKLIDRGSLSATTIVTNVQDFICIVAKGLGLM